MIQDCGLRGIPLSVLGQAMVDTGCMDLLGRGDEDNTKQGERNWTRKSQVSQGPLSGIIFVIFAWLVGLGELFLCFGFVSWPLSVVCSLAGPLFRVGFKP